MRVRHRRIHPLHVEQVPETARWRSPGLPRDDDLVVAHAGIGLRQADVDDLVARGREVLAHVVGRIGSSRWPRSTRTASRTAIGRPWSVIASSAARTVRPVYSTSSTSTTVCPLTSGNASPRLTIGAWADPRQVVAIEGDVERPDRDRCTLVLLDQRRQPPCERDAAAADADEDERVGAAVALDDLVRDARQRAADLIGVEDGALGHGCSLAASPDRVKGGSSEYTDALAPLRLSRGPDRSTPRRCSATCRPRPPARRCCGRRSPGRRTSRTCRPPRPASGTP